MSIVETECTLGNGQNDKKKHFNSNSGDLKLIGEQTYNDWTDEDREENIDPSPEDDRLSFSADDSLASMEPHSAVESWKIAALGHRPQDYLARDLLLNSLWRDERPRVFHSLAKKPPAWIEDQVRHLPGNQVKQAVQLTVLHYLHRRQLAQLQAGDVAANRIGDEGGQLISRLWVCWPYGAKMEPPASAQMVPQNCWCRLAWLCPWCHARRAVALARLLREGPLQQPQGKHLVSRPLPHLRRAQQPRPRLAGAVAGALRNALPSRSEEGAGDALGCNRETPAVRS